MLMPLIVSENVLQTSTSKSVTLLRPQRWRQKINAVGWYDKANFSMLGDRLELERWFSDYLGWHAVRHDPTGISREPIFEGMIWSMTLHLPGLTQTISLDDMSNSVAARYTLTDFSVNPPTTSGTGFAALTNNQDSIDKYGRKDIVLQRGRLDATMANQERDTWLEENAWPRAEKKATSANTLRLDVLLKGYWHTLDWRVYEQQASSGTEDADANVLALKNALGTFIDSTDLDSNTFKVRKYYKFSDEIRTARDIVEEVATFGDTNDDRWVVGVREGRTLYYRLAAKDVPDYWRRIGDPAHWVRHVERGYIVQPWLVRPDNVLRTADIDPLGSVAKADWREDPQLNYIESVQWREPYGLVLEDNKGQRIEAIMAKNVMKGEELFRREFA